MLNPKLVAAVLTIVGMKCKPGKVSVIATIGEQFPPVPMCLQAHRNSKEQQGCSASYL